MIRRGGSELRRFVLAAGIVIIGLALWLLPEMSAWFDRKPDAAWARVEQSGVIRFAINPAYMPFDGLGSHGDFFGIDVDIANDLARRLGKRAEFVIAGYDSLYDVLRVGQAEATISALPIDPGKLGLWAYSQPYFEAGQVMVTNPPGFPKTSEVSLAVEYGSDADAAARYLARRRAGVEIKYTPSAADALKAVVNGWADAAIVDGVSANQLLPKFPELQIVERVTSDPYALAVWGESHQLLAAINATLTAMQQDGTTQKIIDEWMRK
jgi:arginine/lysine/histidine transporter system substrate-binding protein